MADDFIPKGDKEFNTFQTQLATVVSASPGSYGLMAADIAQLSTLQAAWTTSQATHETKRLEAEAATVAKDQARKDYEDFLRGLNHKITGTVSVTAAQRAAAGLPVHSTTRTAVGTPTSAPIGRAEAHGHNTLELHFVNQNTPKRTAKPKGVHACRVYRVISATPPTDPSAYAFLTECTRTPYVDVIPAASAGKTAYYIAQWVNNKGQTGPFGDGFSAVIPS